MPPSESPYGDVPLNLGRKNIRLVTLEHDDASESIKCDLQSHALDDECPAYVALSYAWGAKERYNDIHINGMSFPVGRNLWHFLHQMRIQRQAVLFWIDAISIDQANVLEQNHQVQMMREIYTQARSVWIWLGEADQSTSSDIAMQYLKTRVAFSREYLGRETSLKLWDARQREAILELCKRHYWQRIWIVQEVLLAKEVKILCGGECVDWMKLQKLLEDVQYLAPYQPYSDYTVLYSPAAVIIKAKAQWNGQPQLLALLLERYHRQHSTDVRDKVYALHGLAIDSDAIIINYNISPKALLLQIVRHACSPQAFKTDMEKPKTQYLYFAKLMRESLKVFCDEEELIEHISVGKRKSSNWSIPHTPDWNPVFLNSQTPTAAYPLARRDVQDSGSANPQRPGEKSPVPPYVMFQAHDGDEYPPLSPGSLALYKLAQAQDHWSNKFPNVRPAASPRIDPRTYLCQIDDCPRTFYSAVNLLRHRWAHEEPKLECVVDGCDHRFSSQANLRDHAWQVHRDVVLSLSVTQKLF